RASKLTWIGLRISGSAAYRLTAVLAAGFIAARSATGSGAGMLVNSRWAKASPQRQASSTSNVVRSTLRRADWFEPKRVKVIIPHDFVAGEASLGLCGVSFAAP